MRVACLLLPDLPLVAALRAEPELAGEPLVVASGPGPRAEIVAVSAQAARAGVRPLLGVVHARTLCAALRVRVASPCLERAARAALFDAALSVSPRAEAAAPGSGVYAAEASVYADASGIAALFHSEEGFAGALAFRAAALGLPAVVGLASSRSVARLAARRQAVERGADPAARRSAVQVIAAGDEARFLAPLPIDLLDPDDDLAQSLTRFGVSRLGDLARLPPEALGTRLGPRALRLLALARGEEDPLPIRPPDETRFEEAIDLETPLDRLEPLAFVLRGLLARLVARLELRGLACGDLQLDLALEGGGRDARRIGVAAATLDLRTLLGLLRLGLEARPPSAAVETLRLTAQARPPRGDQLDLFRPAGPAPAVLDHTLAALEALCGSGRVGAPALADDHRPDAFALSPFAPGVPTPRPPAPCDGAAPLALRALRPPLSAEVRAPHGRPEWIRSAVANGHVIGVAGPWRTTGAWWSQEGRFAYDSFDVQTSDGTVTRLRLDLLARRWEIDGVYD